MSQTSIITAALQAASRPEVVESSARLAACALEWRQSAVLGIDTEFVRERTYRAELGLVQVSDGVRAWLIDPLRVERLDVLADLLEDRSIIKVFHSASEDLEVLWLTLGVSPAPMVDTQIACAFLGQPLQQSYHNAVKAMFDVEVDKEQTRSNWLRRPLAEEQLHYAAGDVVFLPLLYRELRERLEKQNRWNWLEEDVERLRNQSKRSVPPEQAYLRIRGAGRLDAESLRVLKQLAQWREETAISRNLARGFVVPDTALLQIASVKPATMRALEALDTIHPRVLDKYGEQLIQRVRDALASGEVVEEIRPLNSAQQKQLDEMKTLVRRQSEALQIDPALLASRKVLEDFIRSRDAGNGTPDRLSGWRKSLITDQLAAPSTAGNT